MLKKNQILNTIWPFLALWLAASPSMASDSGITIKNWLTHPRIVEVRDMYRQVNSSVESGEFSTELRRYDIRSASCAPEPVQEQRLVRDKAGRIRMFGRVKINSTGEPLSIDRYYDINGKLRFVTAGTIMASYRIYLDKNGRVFWSLDKDFVKYRPARYDNSNWETKPLTVLAADAVFNSPQSCSEIK